MLATLRNIFQPQAIVQTLAVAQPLETTIMDRFFKERPTHPLPMIGRADLTEVTRTIPVVRRDGTPISLSGETFAAEFVAPLPVKPKVEVTASELNDLRAMLQNPAAVEAWRKNKIETIRKAVRNTTEGICTVVLNTGKISWPVQLEGGGLETYEIDFGAVKTINLIKKLSRTSRLSEVYALLRQMELAIRKGGVGEKVSFLAGSDVVAVLLDLADQQQTTTDEKPIKLRLGDGKVSVGAYEIHFMDETYPPPTGGGDWIDKVDSKTLLAIADVPGKVWYCAIDSISANNAAVPLHIVPVQRPDDSGISLIGQAKPMPARTSRATCRVVAVE